MRESVPLREVIAHARPGFACGENDPNGTVQIRMHNVSSDGALVMDTLRRVPRGAGSLERFKVEVGDVLFNATNSPELVGKSALFRGFPEPVVYSNHFIRLSPATQRLDSGYLSRWLHMLWRRGDFSRMCKQWVNQASVASDRLLSLEIPLPPLREQRRIATILDKADELRAKRLAALAQLDSLPTAMFSSVVRNSHSRGTTLTETTLGKCVRAGDTINYGVVQPGHECLDGVPIIRVGDMSGGHIEVTALKRIGHNVERLYKRSRLRGDEVLVSCVGHTLGRVALANESMRGFNIARAVARIPLSDQVNRLFVAAYLRTEGVQQYFASQVRTVAQPTLNIKQLSETPVIFPPRELQDDFALGIERVESLRTFHRLSLHQLEVLFASLQHHSFREEL